MALFSFTNPAMQPQQAPAGYQEGMNQYNQQGQNMIDPGQAQLQQSNPIAMAGQQSLGQAFQQANQQGTPSQMQDMGNFSPDMMGGLTPTADNWKLGQALQAQQPKQNWWDRITTEASYPKPFAGGRSF